MARSCRLEPPKLKRLIIQVFSDTIAADTKAADTKLQSDRDTELQRYRATEIQRYKATDTKAADIQMNVS